MTRHILHVAIVGQVGGMFATIVAWPYLFVPALLGLFALWLALPVEGER